MVWVIAFGELFFGDLWCVVWGYGGMRTHFSLLNPLGRAYASPEVVCCTVTGCWRSASRPNGPNDSNALVALSILVALAVFTAVDSLSFCPYDW
ncbi:hypothetical protein CEQ06_03555 [Corynebacterium jeikeium]|nr:hypothetical protein CEQ06_03555 [Corynebacterium jeikeium]